MEDKRRLTDEGTLRVAEPPAERYQIEPRQGWVLVRERQEGEKITAGGVIQPGADFFLNTKSPKHTHAIVVAFSPSVKGLEVDDLVIVTKFSLNLEAIEELTGDKELKLVRDEEVYARLKRICT